MDGPGGEGSQSGLELPLPLARVRGRGRGRERERERERERDSYTANCSTLSQGKQRESIVPSITHTVYLKEKGNGGC